MGDGIRVVIGTSKRARIAACRRCKRLLAAGGLVLHRGIRPGTVYVISSAKNRRSIPRLRSYHWPT